MNEELSNVIKICSTKSSKDLNDYLIGKSQNDLISIIIDLLTMYINDKNSSTIREFITVLLAGYSHKKQKIGYNGYKQEAFVGETIKCEAKPQNFYTEEFEKYKSGQRKTQPKKLDGGGNFTDYTRDRLNKHKNEKDLNMLISGFVNGKLVYIIEFPFNYHKFIEKLDEQIRKWEEKLEGSNSKKGQFLRSANFNYKDYYECDSLKIHYLLPKKELKEYKDYINENFYNFLEKNSK